MYLLLVDFSWTLLFGTSNDVFFKREGRKNYSAIKSRLYFATHALPLTPNVIGDLLTLIQWEEEVGLCIFWFHFNKIPYPRLFWLVAKFNCLRRNTDADQIIKTGSCLSFKKCASVSAVLRTKKVLIVLNTTFHNVIDWYFKIFGGFEPQNVRIWVMHYWDGMV